MAFNTPLFGLISRSSMSKSRQLKTCNKYFFIFAGLKKIKMNKINIVGIQQMSVGTENLEESWMW